MTAIKPDELFEKIRKYAVLYDQTKEQYRNSDYKNIIWKKVAKELNVEGQEEECKKKWNRIQDSLRRARQKNLTKSGQAATSTPKYKYEALLEFLIPHLAERKGLTNVPDEDSPETGNESQQYSSIQETQQLPHVSNADELDETVNRMLSPPTITLTNQVSAEKGRSNAERKRKLINVEANPQESPSSQLMAYILAEKEAKKTKSNCEQHPVDAFLVEITQSLKSLDPIRLHSAKGKIFNIVQELELEQLTANNRKRNAIVYNYPVIPSAQTSSSSPPSHITLSQEGGPYDSRPPSFPDPVVSTPTPDPIISDDDTDLTYFQI